MSADGESPLIRAVTAGRSLDQARALFEETYNGESFETDTSDQEFSFRYTTSGDVDMTVRTSTFLGEISGTLQPEAEYIVAWITDGQGRYHVEGGDLDLVRGRPVVFPTLAPFSFEMSDYRQNLVHFRAGFLEQVASEHEGVRQGPLQFDTRHVPDVAALQRWNQVVGTAARTIIGSDPSPLLQAELDRMTATALLDTFSHRTHALDPVLLAPRNARLREAVEFIHANVHLPISASDVAKVAHLSPRGLQAAFSRQLGCTPTDFIRDVRLDHVRVALAAAHPDERTVGQVARQWGFVHLSRFAAAYAAKFGEYPSDTLRS